MPALSRDEQARIAGITARQTSDADFLRRQIPRHVAHAARKGWTYKELEVSTVNLQEQENVPAGAREAVARAIAAARREADGAFLKHIAEQQVRDELIGAVHDLPSIQLADLRDVRHTLIRDMDGGDTPERERGCGQHHGPDGGLDRVELRLGDHGAVERDEEDGAVERGGEDGAVERGEEDGAAKRGRGDSVGDSRAAKRSRGEGGVPGSGGQESEGGSGGREGSERGGGREEVEEDSGASKRGKGDSGAAERDKEDSGVAVSGNGDNRAAECGREGHGAAKRDKGDGRAEEHIRGGHGAVERGREDGGAAERDRGDGAGQAGQEPLEGDDLDLDGYLSDMTEGVEEALPKGTQQEQDVWYEEETLPCPPVETGTSAETSTNATPNGSNTGTPSTSSSACVPAQNLPLSKKRNVPARVIRQQARELAQEVREKALADMRKVLTSRKDVLVGGLNGLQAYRARAVQACLYMMTREGKGMMVASEVAAQANLFSGKWGARLVREWTQAWVKSRLLPVSQRGRHPKVMSILSHPTVRAAVRAYLRSEKWSQNPVKLRKLFNNELDMEEAREYRRVLESEEMPNGLKDFVTIEILPKYHIKVGRLGLSRSTMRRLLLSEGFTWSEHRKAIYYDGHERPDVVKDRKERFIPAMQAIRDCLVQYQVGAVNTAVEPDFQSQMNGVLVRPRLVLVAHDEMVAQAHDGQRWSWLLNGESPIKKKGPGRGLHQSDFICSTVGWLREASVTLEYGKNHEGFWNGELFCKQVCIS